MSIKFIYLILLLLPSYLIRFSIFDIPTTLLEILIYLLTIIWLWGNKGKLKQKAIKVWRQLGSLAWPLALFFIATIISLIISPNLRISAGIFKGWYFDAFLFIFIVLDQIKTKEQINNCLRFLGVSVLLLSGYGVMEYFLGFGLDTNYRLNSIYPTANFVSLFIVPVFFLTLLVFDPGKFRKEFKLIWSTVIGLAVYLSLSYGGILAILAGLAYLAWQNKKIRCQLSLGLLISILMVVGLQMNTPKFDNLLNFESHSSTASRLQIWQTSLYLINQHPILGIGLGNFEQAYIKAVPDLFFPPLEWLVNKTHNLYLNLWLEMGILGLFAFLWLTWEFFKQKNSHLIVVASKAAMIALLVHGLVDIPIFKNDLMILWLFVLILPSLNKKVKNSNKRASEVRR